MHEIKAAIASWNNRYGIVSFGGAFGGILFGMLSDKIGRSKTMIVTIFFLLCIHGTTSFEPCIWWL